MRYSTYINNQKCIEWSLNAAQGALFDLINQAHSWASPIIVDGVVYYWMSRNAVITQLPLFYKKSDTVYRHFTALSEKGLIDYAKQGNKDLVRLTEKGKTWNEFNPDSNNPNSDLNPNNNSKLGNKSEQTRKQIRANSEINPTDNNINNNNINNNNNPLPPKGESACAEELAQNQKANNTVTGEKNKSESEKVNELEKQEEKVKEEKKESSASVRIDYAGIANAYNQAIENTGANLPYVMNTKQLSDKRKRAIKKMVSVFNKRFGNSSVAAFNDYFADFIEVAPAFYFGENNTSWVASFDYLMRETTLEKVIERQFGGVA